MATATPRQTLIYNIQKRLGALSPSQLMTVAKSIDDGSITCSIDDLSEPELYELIVDYIKSERLRALEDEGKARLLLLDNMLSDLLATNSGEVEASQATALRTGDVTAHQQGSSTPPLPDHNHLKEHQATWTSDIPAHPLSPSSSVGDQRTHNVVHPQASCEPVTMATNLSSKYKNILKVPINSGSHTPCQLNPKKENIGTLTKMTLGEKDPNKKTKTILLVGETGAGKSTLINALVNYNMGVKWEDDVWFQIVEDERKRQSQSQTSDVIVYEIFGFEGQTLPYSLTIIDTPGYGNTAGIEHDAIVRQRLLDLFRSDDGVHEINAVGLVMKAGENRLSDRLRYILESVMSLFGKKMEKKIVALITHSDGLTPEDALQALEDAKIKCAKDEKNRPLHFMFNNRQRTERTPENEAVLKSAWDVTMKGMSQFTDFLRKTEPQNLMKTIEVLRAQIRLTACIQNLQERIKLTELKQREIQQTQEALEKYQQEMKKNEKFTVEVDEPYKDVEPIDGGMWWLVFFQGAVCCKKCQETCHYPGCTMAWKPGHCEVMKDGYCTSCTGKCHVSDHVKENWRFVTKTRKVKKTPEAVKEKYEQSKADSKEKSSLLEDLKKKNEELQKEKDQILEKSFNHVVNLEQNALKVNAVSTHVDLDLLIEKMKEKGDTEKIQKLKEIKRQMDEDEGTRSVWRYMSGKLTAAGEVMKEQIPQVTFKT